jgi:hypothetical protein
MGLALWILRCAMSAHKCRFEDPLKPLFNPSVKFRINSWETLRHRDKSRQHSFSFFVAIVSGGCPLRGRLAGFEW